MSILDFLFPSKCISCDTQGKVICEDCFRNIPIHIQNNNQTLSVYSYRHDLVNELLWKLKYKHSGDVAKMFGKILGEMLIPIILEINSSFERIILIPIPLNQGDKRLHNHAEVLANEINSCLTKNLNKHSEVRNIFIKNAGRKQAHVKERSARLDNVKNALSVNPHEANSLKANNLYIIVDDISTTGATINEARNTLINFVNPTSNTPIPKILSIVVAH